MERSRSLQQEAAQLMTELDAKRVKFDAKMIELQATQEIAHLLLTKSQSNKS
ncbi:hypothetical protein [Adhaeribacter rhizoryzae]|uniref:hypothetical protein n=1 Tax=Adhaeribacter rhizoryzae TaxID=2607907 RepID=UPI00167FDF83|nr:hypothetical protein [Adhaeribacter rhizoryzae]